MSGRATISPQKASLIRRRLLRWFDRHKRDLPWRQSRDPYAVWLSEMMLQQTQVATVIPYYERFLARFPRIHDLAAAELDDVLRLWSGLGYYARARNLHAAARKVVADFNGVIPSNVEQLQTLPGIGRYTAGAVASIAFDKKAPVVDGNVARVIARLCDADIDVRAGPGNEWAWDTAERLLPRRRCGEFNQAMMELGATVCLPGEAARCLTCPLRNDCKASEAGTVALRPVKTRQTTVRNETHVVVALQRNGKWLIVRRPPSGLWGGLWELPTAVLNGEKTVTRARRLAGDLVDSSITINRSPFCEFQHQLTHRTITFIGHVGRTKPGATHTSKNAKPKSPTSSHRPVRGRWLTLDQITSLGLSKAMRHVISALQHQTDNGKSKRTPALRE